MTNIILVIAGIIIFGYSLYKHVEFLRLTKKTAFKKWWVILLVLVMFFFLGYIFFAYWLIVGAKGININSLATLVSYIFFFGAIFVLITISLIYSTVKNLIKEKEETQRLQMDRIGLLQDKEIKLKKEIQEKTEEMQKTDDGLKEKLQRQVAILEKSVIGLQKENKLLADRGLKMSELDKRATDLSEKKETE
jgi:membrane protein implicated in regulation of membrane protease activity